VTTLQKIAVVEDNPDNWMLLEALLEDRYQLFHYGTGRAALLGLPLDPPVVILLDISLPEMDGTQVLRRLRQDAALSTIPVIALTAHAMAGDREKFLNMGFDDYVSKPIVDEQILFAAIERLVPGAPATLTQKRDRIRRRYIARMTDKIGSLSRARADVAAGVASDESLKQIRDTAHNLRGSGASYGFPEITQAAARVEDAAPADLLDSIQDLLRVLNATVAASTV